MLKIFEKKIFKNGNEPLFSLRGRLATMGIGVLLLVVAYHAVFGANGLMMYEQKRRESQELDRQIKSLQQQNSAVESENKALKSNPETIEKEARERLKYARPGEFVYTLPTAPVAPGKEKK